MSKHYYLIKYDTETRKWDWEPNIENKVLPKSIEHNGKWYEPTEDKTLEDTDIAISENMERGVRFMNYYEANYNNKKEEK